MYVLYWNHFDNDQHLFLALTHEWIASFFFFIYDDTNLIVRLIAFHAILYHMIHRMILLNLNTMKMYRKQYKTSNDINIYRWFTSNIRVSPLYIQIKLVFRLRYFWIECNKSIKYEYVCWSGHTKWYRVISNRVFYVILSRELNGF